MFRPPALGQPKNASAYTPPGKETDMQTPLHFILQFDMKSPYNRAYRNATEALSCSLSAGEAAGKTPCTTIVLCDTDEAIRQHRKAGLPVIAVSHTGNSSEELMGTPWLILSPEALTRDFLYKVYCRHYERPMWILETERCRLRELSAEDFDALLLLQKENAQNPEGCFFPAGCDNPEDFLMNYIRHQYPFFDFGLYAVLEKETGNFMGIAGFTGITEIASDGISLSAEVSYALLQKYQRRGLAKEVLLALLSYGRKTGEFRQFTARIRPDNVASAALAKKCGIQIYTI